MMTLLVGLGCKDDAPVDSGESPWGACAPFSMELVQEWDQDALLGPGAQPHTDGDAGIGLGDFDGDGWLDAFIVTPEGSLLLQNNDSGQLVEGGAVGFFVEAPAFPQDLIHFLAEADGDLGFRLRFVEAGLDEAVEEVARVGALQGVVGASVPRQESEEGLCGGLDGLRTPSGAEPG